MNSGPLDMTCNYHYAPGTHRPIAVLNSVDDPFIIFTPGLTYLDETCRILVNGDPVLDPGFSASDPDHTPVDYYVVQDAHYNVTAIHDDQGDLIERYAYDPYGRRRVYVPQDALDTAGTVPVDRATRVSIGSPGVDQPYAINDFGHQGLTHDEDTGLIENRARMYVPPLGRFAQRDPLKYIDSLHLLNYVNSRPTFFLDPWGTSSTLHPGYYTLLAEQGIVIKGGAALAGGVVVGEALRPRDIPHPPGRTRPNPRDQYKPKPNEPYVEPIPQQPTKPLDPPVTPDPNLPPDPNSSPGWKSALAALLAAIAQQLDGCPNMPPTPENPDKPYYDDPNDPYDGPNVPDTGPPGKLLENPDGSIKGWYDRNGNWMPYE